MTAEQETEARKLRDAIYGPQTENNWSNCKDTWTADLEWLRSHAPEVKP